MSITEFLEARIAEDESLARVIQERGEWRGIQVNAATETAVHVERWNPGRVLAECKAKRAIIRDSLGMVEAIERLSAALPDSPNQDPDAPWRTAKLRHLAAIYADHSDYKQEWAL